MNRTRWIAGGVLVVGVLAIVAWRSHEAPATRRVAEPSGSTERQAPMEPAAVGHDGEASLARRLEALGDEVSELREEVARLRSEARAGSKVAEPEPELSPEQEKALWDDHMTLVEAGFDEEPIDARWASDVGALIQRALAGRPALRAATRSAECRFRTCRVELDTDAQGKMSDDISSLTRALGAELPTVHYDRIDEAGGRQTQVLYFKREQPEDAPPDEAP